jgi:hypothetical protein
MEERWKKDLINKLRGVDDDADSAQPQEPLPIYPEFAAIDTGAQKRPLDPLAAMF